MSIVIFIGLTCVNWTPENTGITQEHRAIPSGRETIVRLDLEGIQQAAARTN